MKIYTKSGDEGQTGLFGGGRVPKDHLRIQAYGTLDELNGWLGLILSKGKLPGDLGGRLERIQGELFQLGAELATPSGKKLSMALLSASQIQTLETEIDGMEETLPGLKTFILPGGTESASMLHLARTVCRRGERALLPLHRDEPLRPEVIQYVNRLSDYLFVCARYACEGQGGTELAWKAPTA